MSIFSDQDVLSLASKVVSIVQAETPNERSAINVLNAARSAILGSESRRLPAQCSEADHSSS